jgi:Domain of unknown function (DUF4160)
MPIILRIGSFRFYFYSGESHEPPHIHVDKGSNTAKFWLQPIARARVSGFKEHQLKQIERLILQHHALLLSAWQELN